MIECEQFIVQACITRFSNPKNLTLQKDEYLDNYVNAWIIEDDINVYQCFDNDNDNIKNKLNFKSRYHIIKDNYRISYKKKHWSLLVKGKTINKKTIIGWISHDNIIESRFPKRNTTNNIFQKVLIKEGNRNQCEALQVFKSKHLLKTKEGIEVRSVFYVFDYYPRSEPSPESEGTKSLLIGVMPQLNIFSDKAVSIIGWVDRAKVSFWTSRTACEFPVGIRNVIYDLSSENIIAEPFVKQPLNYNELRNPILKDLGSEYIIGAFMQLNREQLNIRDRIDKIRTGLEVLFVIDGTRSMTPAFKETLNAVKLIADELIDNSKNCGLNIPKLGLTFYRDKPTRSPLQKINGIDAYSDNPYCKEECVSFKMMSPASFKKTLSRQIACDSDSSINESMYKGLIKGVQQCGFLTGVNQDPKCMRIVIHIGDEGDNGQENYTSKDVTNFFEKFHIFKYISIDVSEKLIGQSQFSKDVNKIRYSRGKSIHLRGVKGLSNVVKKILEDFHNKTVELQAQIKIISKGFAGTTEGQKGIFSSELIDLAKKVISANQIDLNKYNAFQQYVVGKVPKTSALKKYLLVSLTDLEKISSFLTQLIEKPGNVRAYV